MTRYDADALACIRLSCETSLKKRCALYDSVERPSQLYDDYAQAEQIVQRLREMDAVAICRGDEAYPDALYASDCPPVALYCRGDISLLRDRRYKLAVVGTRRPTRYGKDVTTAFVRELTRAGVAIVSGMARGVDAYAHRACLEESGKTIAVVATGVDLVYPSENLELAQRIIREGLLVSEYPPGTPPMAFRFPERNRIVSALSDATMIPEAGERSGSMITANLTIEQGKELFVIPGSVLSPQSAGCNRKLKELQGSLTTSPDDILHAAGMDRRKAQTAARQITIEQQAVLDALQEGEMHFSQILDRVQSSVAELSALLTQMEIYGLICKLSGNCYACAPQL